MQVVLTVAEFAFLLSILFISARRTIRPRGTLTGIFQGTLVFYGLAIGGAFVLSVVIPAFLLLMGADRFVVNDNFPEAIIVPPVVLLGWFFAWIYAIIVRVLYDFIRLLRGGGWPKWE